jgi:S1-C subfamily serine protease
MKDDKITDSALGTGAIVDSAGYVLTNWHVIAGYDGAIIFFKPEIGTDPDKNSAYGSRLVAADGKIGAGCRHDHAVRSGQRAS